MWNMRNIILLGLIILFIIILYACTIGRSANPENTATTLLQNTPALGLTVQGQNANPTPNTVGHIIHYVYVVTNSGSTALAGPVAVTDDKVPPPVNCPPVNTVGNQNNDLDPGESITCTGDYAITQADLNAGSVTNNATATAGGVSSNQIPTTVTLTL